jgi:Protein of unknown function (DUF2844)
MSATPRATSEAVANYLADASARIRAWTDEGGTTIHKYASGDGRIFAYTWQSPTMPDLNRLAYLLAIQIFIRTLHALGARPNFLQPTLRLLCCRPSSKAPRARTASARHCAHS